MKQLYTCILKICLVSLLLQGAYSSRAQYVTLPDTNFVNWLKTNGYAGCLNGQQLDTTCTAVLNTNALHCSASPIRDLTGIQYFKNLDTLDCSNDSLYTIPSFPGSIMWLSCAYNNLTAIPALPGNLNYLDCSYNQITGLPVLPSTLDYLDCHANHISVIPALPSTLYSIDCSDNQVTSLPALPAAITVFFCNHNFITTLPALPEGLGIMGCGDNMISTLPTIPSSVYILTCSSNQITTLPVLPASMGALVIDSNLITNVPSWPASLYFLSCRHNQLTNMPTLPVGLNTFVCGYNQLTSLPDLPPFCYELDFTHNLLTSIPPLPDSATYVYLDSNANLACLPQLTRIGNLTFTNTAITCLPNNGTVYQSNPPVSFYSLCGLFNNTGCGVYWNISGQVYDDVNTDCQFDYTDVGLGYYKVNLLSNGNTLQQVYTSYDGSYSFQAPSGNYIITADTTVAPFVPYCPLNDAITGVLTPYDSLKAGNNFAVVCRSQGFDVGVTSIVYDYALIPRPAAIMPVYSVAGDLSALYGAHCAAGLSGQLQIIYNGEAQYIGPAPGAVAPDNVTGNTLTWNIADFGNVNNRSDFNLLFMIDTSATAGTQVCFTETITPDIGDYNTENNVLRYCFTIANALDPNEKEVYPNTIDSAGEWLTYTVRFQNTGNAPAQNILVTDTLDSHLDPSTFQLLAYSAKNTTQVFGNIVKFNFVNINLPDSNTSNTLSRGYVQFRVKTASPFSQAEKISNTAYIYFDLNPAVVTNTVVDSVASFANGIAPVSDQGNSISIYPNPATDQLFIKSENLSPKSIAVYDVDGRLISTQPFTPQININRLSSGVYFVEVTSNAGVVRKRFVKM